MRTNAAAEDSAFVPEEFAFQEASWDRGAIHLHEASIPPRAALVDRASDHFFSGAGFARDEDCHVCGGDRLDEGEDAAETPAPTYNCFDERKSFAVHPSSAQFVSSVEGPIH